MQENTFIEDIKSLIEKYNVKLAERNIMCSVSRKYFESSVASHEVLEGFEYFISENEEKRAYKGQKNRYYYIIIRFSPTIKNLVKKSDCKEYAFIIRKIERAHIGLKPEETLYSQKKLLKKIEKRIQKILQKAETQDTVKICKDSGMDFFRYMFSSKYDHKKFLFGKSQSFWETFWGVIAISALVLTFFVAWLCSVL